MNPTGAIAQTAKQRSAEGFLQTCLGGCFFTACDRAVKRSLGDVATEPPNARPCRAKLRRLFGKPVECPSTGSHTQLDRLRAEPHTWAFRLQEWAWRTFSRKSRPVGCRV